MIDRSDRALITDLRFANSCLDVAGQEDDPASEPFGGERAQHDAGNDGHEHHGVFGWRQAQLPSEEGRHRGDVEEQAGEAEGDGKSDQTEAPIAEDHDILPRHGTDSERAACMPRQGLR